jgi:putative FmdB family regulatory protein
LTWIGRTGITLATMPTYEYVCSKCGHEFECVQSMADKPLAVCPKDRCGQKRWGRGKVKRQISGGAGLLFKGSGFYITDHRSENYKAGAKKDSAAAAPAPADSKPAPAKKETKPDKPGPKA